MIKFLCQCVEEERQHCLAHRAAIREPTPMVTYHLVSHKGTFQSYIDTPTEDLNQHPESEQFEPHFENWWQLHDTTGDAGYPDPEIQRHTLFMICLQMQKKGFNICQTREAFMDLHKENDFWTIIYHWSTKLDDQDYPEVPFPRVVVPVYQPEGELYKRLTQLATGCSPLQQAPGIMDKHLIPECLYVEVNMEADHLEKTEILLQEMTMETAAELIRKMQTNILLQQSPSPIPGEAGT